MLNNLCVSNASGVSTSKGVFSSLSLEELDDLRERLTRNLIQRQDRLTPDGLDSVGDVIAITINRRTLRAVESEMSIRYHNTLAF